MTKISFRVTKKYATCCGNIEKSLRDCGWEAWGLWEGEEKILKQSSLVLEWKDN